MQTQTQFRVALQGVRVPEQILAAQALLKQSRSQGLRALNEVFRAGIPPEPPLNGRYCGQLVALDIAPGLTQLADGIARAWMPWQGKTFRSALGTGDNIFARDALTLSHLYWPFYRGFVDDTSGTFRAFSFRTYLAPGKSDPDRTVLKIDYDLPENPRASIRRVLDELVQVAEGLYLGQAHVHWWWGRWQRVAYFTLADR